MRKAVGNFNATLSEADNRPPENDSFFFSNLDSNNNGDQFSDNLLLGQSSDSWDLPDTFPEPVNSPQYISPDVTSNVQNNSIGYNSQSLGMNILDMNLRLEIPPNNKNSNINSSPRPQAHQTLGYSPQTQQKVQQSSSLNQHQNNPSRSPRSYEPKSSPPVPQNIVKSPLFNPRLFNIHTSYASSPRTPYQGAVPAVQHAQPLPLPPQRSSRGAHPYLSPYQLSQQRGGAVSLDEQMQQQQQYQRQHYQQQQAGAQQQHDKHFRSSAAQGWQQTNNLGPHGHGNNQHSHHQSKQYISVQKQQHLAGHQQHSQSAMQLPPQKSVVHTPNSIVQQNFSPPMAPPFSNPQLVYVVQFKSSHGDYIANQKEQDIIQLGDYVVVQCDEGVDVGRVTFIFPVQQFLEMRGLAHLKITHNKEVGAVAVIVRIATNEEVHGLQVKSKDEEEVFMRADAIARHSFPYANIVDVEYQFDRSKLTVYFTAQPEDQHLDFHSYIREMHKVFHTRIYLRRIKTNEY